MAQFVSQHGEQIRVVGLGGQDSVEEAEAFVSDTGTDNVEMYWDPTLESWSFFEVRGQPAAILLNPDGSVAGSWTGALSTDDVLAAAGI